MALEFESHSDAEKEYGMVPCTCCSKLVPGEIISWKRGDDKTESEKIPLWMPCRACEKWLAHLEHEYNDILDGMCIDCFREETEQ